MENKKITIDEAQKVYDAIKDNIRVASFKNKEPIVLPDINMKVEADGSQVISVDAAIDIATRAIESIH